MEALRVMDILLDMHFNGIDREELKQRAFVTDANMDVIIELFEGFELIKYDKDGDIMLNKESLVVDHLLKADMEACYLAGEKEVPKQDSD